MPQILDAVLVCAAQVTIVSLFGLMMSRVVVRARPVAALCVVCATVAMAAVISSMVADLANHADGSLDVSIRTVVSYPLVFSLYLQLDPGLTDTSSTSGSLESAR